MASIDIGDRSVKKIIPLNVKKILLSEVRDHSEPINLY